MISTPLVLLLALSSALVNMAAAQTGTTSNCVTCVSRGVTSYFDGCNTCTCSNTTSATGAASCTKRACEPNADPTTCAGKCDGFTVPSDDGCGTCTCKNGAQDKCTASTTACRDPCTTVTCASGKRCVADPKQCFTTPCPQFQCVADDGAHKCGCNGAVCKATQGCANNGTCVNLPTQNWLADGAPFCVRGGGGRCCGDQFGASCAATDTCVNGACVAAARVETACGTTASPCYSCKTAGVKSYFDGCNSCSCQNNVTAVCTQRACAAVLPDPKSCQMQCDGARSQDDGVCGVCLCIGGEKTQCSKCGVGAKCALNSAGKPECVAVVPPPPTKNTCADKPCADGETCVDEPKQCVTTPCPQYRCDKPTTTSACAAKPCAADEICTDEPKQCFTTPCPQYRCDKKQACGCADPAVKCARGQTCQDNTCQPLPPVMIPAGAADGTPICLRAGGACCGAGYLCGDDEVCEKNQCIKATQCAPPTNTCFTCKTPGVKSYSDGCNTCTCTSDGQAACTERACIALAHDPKQCVGHCDGFLTEDDGECGRCTCVGGEKTNCSKCGVGAGCQKDAATGKSKCVAVVPPKGACDAKPCGVDETCVEEPKQCITTPCPQYRCEKNPQAGKCYSCDTPGVKSFYDGCNNCACTENGGLCTLLACIDSLPDPKQCARQCDGFITEDDGQCGRCLCIGGKKTQCSNTKCTNGQPEPGTKCASCDASEACKNAKVPKGDECNTCKCVDGKTTECTSRRCSAECKGVTKCATSGQICIGEPKQCITTPCDQFTCTDIGSAAALAEEQRFTMDDNDGAAASLVASLVAIVVALIATL